jgi:hypothetical protein
MTPPCEQHQACLTVTTPHHVDQVQEEAYTTSCGSSTRGGIVEGT